MAENKKMKKNDWIKSIKIIILCLVIGLGVSFISAWTAPSGAPASATNTKEPVTAEPSGSSNLQAKTGGLSVNAFSVTTGSQFNGDVTVNSLSGGTDRNVCVDKFGKIKICQ
jgi:flagellar basal body-associated protein FliL